MTTLIVVGVIVIVLIAVGVYLWATYRSLVTLKGNVDAAWSDISAQLQRRADLIPTIVDTVKGHASHEQKVLDSVTSARAETLRATDATEASEAEGHMQKALRGVFSVAEGYPKLQSSQDFLRLQSELVDTEDRIQVARRHYNGGVRELNTKIKVFPTSSFAKGRGFSQAAFFESAEPSAIAEPPRVQF
ncbi:LemA family protein [Curtobacterium sp. Leaf261]|uniref:LemA family protein n=1 Tax=Curtobacterium sp. Leaf261 TaxID=1736311 RepID=UPI003FA49FA4